MVNLQGNQVSRCMKYIYFGLETWQNGIKPLKIYTFIYCNEHNAAIEAYHYSTLPWLNLTIHFKDDSYLTNDLEEDGKLN